MKNFILESLPGVLSKLTVSEAGFKNIPPYVRKEIKERLYTAEYHIAVVRLLLVLINITVYLFFMDRSKAMPELAWLIIVSASLYSVLIVWLKPYRRYHILMASFYTSTIDALLISFWIMATGKYFSPFFPLWYISIIATALRYSYKVTMRVAIIYSLLYLAIISFRFNIVPYLDEVIVRITYILLVAALGGILSREVLNQINAKLAIKKSEDETRKREVVLQEVNDLLEERVKERTKELNHANEVLRKINEDLDNFVYSTSHDLKSPIMNMEALVGIAFSESGNKDPELDEVKSRIYNSLNRMKGTIGHLAQVAKAQKEIYTDVEPVNFKEITNEVIADNEEVIKKAGATIETDFAKGTITLSHTCIKSILYNFISNAIKYRSPDRPPHVKVKTLCCEKGLTLSVQDNGLGMDLTKNKDKLFTIFKRFHDHVEGAGIGLYMVKRMIEKNEGRIEVESEVGKGSTFRVIFPRVAEEKVN